MPRLSVDIPVKLHRRLQRCFPWGTQAAVIRRVAELVCERVEKDGLVVVEQLICKTYDPLDSEVYPRERIKNT